MMSEDGKSDLELSSAAVLPSGQNTVILEAKTPWKKPRPILICDLSGRSLDLSRILRSDRTLHDKRLDRFTDGITIIGSCHLVSPPLFLTRFSDSAESTLRRLADQHGRYGNDQTQIRRGSGDSCMVASSRIENAKRLSGPIFLGTPDEADNYGMWLHIVISSVRQFQNHRSEYNRFLCYAKHDWQRRFLRWLGLEDDDLILQNRAESYWCSDVGMLRYSHRDLAVLPSDREAFSQIGALCSGSDRSSTHERIFVSRLSRTQTANAYRGLTNEQELIDALAKYDFTVIEPENLSFAEQVTVFSRARVIVGLGGAAMFNTVFCHPTCRVITIESGVAFLNAHTTMIASVGCDYVVIIGAEDESDPRPTQKRWSLDVPAAVSAIRDVL